MFPFHILDLYTRVFMSIYYISCFCSQLGAATTCPLSRLSGIHPVRLDRYIAWVQVSQDQARQATKEVWTLMNRHLRPG